MNESEEMAWNAPGGGDKQAPKGNGNPWARRREPSGGGGPDFEDFWGKLRGRFGGGSNGQKFTGAGLLAAAAVVLWLFSGVYQVDDAERAVVLTFGKYSSTTGPGLHWRMPYPLQRLVKVNTGRIRNTTDRSLMLTQDENIVDVEIAAQYKVSNAEDFVFRVFEPEITLAQALKSAVREVVGKEKMDFLLTAGRVEIESRTQELLQSILDSYRTGITVTEVNLKDAQPPDPVQDAFSDVTSAQQDQTRLQNEAEAYANDILPRASGAAARETAEAEGYRERVVAEAEGKAARFSLLLAEYEQAPQVTRKRLYLDAMQTVLSNTGKILVDGDAGNQMLYLPLEQLLKRPADSTPSGSTPQSAPRAAAPATPNPLYEDGRSRSRN
ncbi:MAG: FtsH protease activity modulator HflK [Nevskiales bacterium]